MLQRLVAVLWMLAARLGLAADYKAISAARLFARYPGFVPSWVFADKTSIPANSVPAQLDFA